VSYATARAQLVSTIEAITPTDPRLFTEKFRHLPEGRSGIGNVASRHFWLEANVDGEGGVAGPYTPLLEGQPRLVFAMTLTVAYRAQNNRAVMDEVLAADQRDIAIALLTPSNWDRPTSGIHAVTDSPLYLPTRRALVDGNVEQRIAFALRFN
jgi:hypothetical protein